MVQLQVLVVCEGLDELHPALANQSYPLTLNVWFSLCLFAMNFFSSAGLVILATGHPLLDINGPVIAPYVVGVVNCFPHSSHSITSFSGSCFRFLNFLSSSGT